MIEQSFIIEDAFSVQGGDDTANEARAKYKSNFPGRSARRMTHLGMLVGLCVNRLQARLETPILYASAFAESSSLESFIESFPQASPSLFQSSIHPSAVEQALIPRAQAVHRFYPITSDSNLAGQLLENSFLLDEDRILLLGGEERGSWLCPFDLASKESFAFGLRLIRTGPGIGTITLAPSRSQTTARAEMLPRLAESIEQRKDLTVPSFAFDAELHLRWI